MPTTVVVGMQWGDEGKGKVIDLMSPHAHVVVRINGGKNSGRTIVNEVGESVLHQIPAGIFNPEAINIIERGVVVHIPSLLEEIRMLEVQGVFLGNLQISLNAHMLMPWHIAADIMAEERARKSGGLFIGTTKSGIGPCYEDKAGRRFAIRMGDMREKGAFLIRLESVYKEKLSQLKAFYGKVGMPSWGEIKRQYLEARERILPHLADTRKTIQWVVENRKSVLLEVAHAFGLDPDHGTFPYNTSSNTTALSACNLVGISPINAHIIGVVKAYPTRVGEGVLPTLIDPQSDEFIREKGNEYGATTGRPRRCGWLDVLLLRHAIGVNQCTELALTKADILGLFPGEIKMCTGYAGVEGDIGDEEIYYLDRQVPIYDAFFEPWGSFEGCRFRGELPSEMRRYVTTIENLTRTPITLLSIGPKRKEIITL